MRTLLPVTLVAVLSSSLALAGEPGAGPPGPTQAAPTPRKAATIAEAWRALPTITGHGCADEDLIFDYGAGGGMRNFFCRALTVFSWKTLLSLAPTAPFRAGPHQGGKLKLDSERDFGRYDARFVRWAVDNLIPAENDGALRAETQAAYDAQVRTLARTYWEVQRAIASNPAWRTREVNIYLRAADDASVKWDASVIWFYHDVLGTDWGGYDPNHIRSATMWWLRRTKDGTAALWHGGLEKLLGTYDAAWLGAHRGPWPKKLPERPRRAQAPEYR
ncbi:MAG: hypothetical protein A2138_06825 [Deltaproteobacteria bacterium RBG_16_71_12]|nr:MAG: hypothetical protein A2138_06825 [Deltaproteobacteria bacterium RBG_16_71_12]